MTIRLRENEVFERWKAKRPLLVRDGLVDESAYLESTPRIALILKDVNDEGGGGWDLRDVLADGSRWQTWNTVARWMRGLRELDRELAWSEVRPKPTPEERRRAVQSLAVINIKKEPGAASAKKSDVARYAREDSPFIREQFELYSPDVAICGGVGEEFGIVLEAKSWKRTRRGVRYFETDRGCHVIDYYHPQVRYPLDLLFYSLVDAVRELRGYS